MRAFWLFLVAFGLGAKRHWHILFAIILGVVAGGLFPVPIIDNKMIFTPLHSFFIAFGEIFLGLIKMLVIPLIMSSLIVGISSLGDSKQLGRMGAKVLFYFLIFMVISALLGGGLALLLEPGDYLKQALSDPNTINAKAVHDKLAGSQTDLHTLFFNMIPDNLFESLANFELIPVIIFTTILGIAVTSIGEAGRPIISFFESLFTATMRMTDWLMVLAVPGVFSLAFTTVSQTGVEIFKSLYIYIATLLLALLIQTVIILPLFLKFIGKIKFMNLYRAVSEATMVAFGTASSSATLPITIACCERRAGISNRIASFVLPTGATINKTGTTLFEVIAALCLCQAYGVPLDALEWGLIIVFSIVASIAAAGVPSTGWITITIVLSVVAQMHHLPLTHFAGGLAMILAIDRVLDMCRTVVNVLSSCTVAALVAASEGELNRDILNNQDKWTDVVS